MRPTIDLPPGKHVTIGNAPGWQVMFSIGFHGTETSALIGDKYVSTPIYVLATPPGELSRMPGAMWRFDVVGGVIRCSDFQVWTERPEQFIRLTDMEDAIGGWDNVRTLAIAAATWVPAPDGYVPGDLDSVRAYAVMADNGEVYVLPKGDSLVGEARRMPRATSRSLKDGSFLRQVADVYNTDSTGGLAAVADAFGVHNSTAKKYVKAARDAGLIEDRRRNRSSVKED